MKQPRWKMQVFCLVIHALLFWQAAVDYYFYLNFNFLFARRAWYQRTVQRAHWIGSHFAKPHRLAFYTLAGVLILGLFIAPTVRASMLWSTGWGLVFSTFVMIQSSTSFVRTKMKKQMF